MPGRAIAWLLMGATMAFATPVVRVRVERAGGSANAAVFRIQVEGSGLALGAYQGTLRWDPTQITVDSVKAGKDGFRLVNGNDRAKGLLRFSGFTPTGFKSTEAALVFVHGRTVPTVTQMEASLDVAGDVDGHAVAKSGLLGSKGPAVR